MKIRLDQPTDREASLDVRRAAFDGDRAAAIVVAVRDEEGSFAMVAEEEGECGARATE
jgi:predicted N-acetyltransferase YhbS